MADATPEPIVVSPEEKRFLAGFFRRQMLPWAAVLLVIPAAASWWLGGDDGSAREARTAAALAQVRTENQALRADLADLVARVDSGRVSDRGGNELERRVEDAKQSVRMIEARVTAELDRRIDVLEARAASPSASGESGPPPDAAAWDVSAILDRLYALEMRDGVGVSEARVVTLEGRVARLEAPGVPSSAGPALEGRGETLPEGRSLEPFPAAPARD